LVKELILVVDHAQDASSDSSENFGWTKAIGSVNVATIFDELLEGGDADFEELVQVGADDGKEFEPFEKGLGRVLSLLENAMIKLKPTELSI
jgi:hypothetical protein